MLLVRSLTAAEPWRRNSTALNGILGQLASTDALDNVVFGRKTAADLLQGAFTSSGQRKVRNQTVNDGLVMVVNPSPDELATVLAVVRVMQPTSIEIREPDSYNASMVEIGTKFGPMKLLFHRPPGQESWRTLTASEPSITTLQCDEHKFRVHTDAADVVTFLGSTPPPAELTVTRESVRQAATQLVEAEHHKATGETIELSTGSNSSSFLQDYS